MVQEDGDEDVVPDPSLYLVVPDATIAVMPSVDIGETNAHASRLDKSVHEEDGGAARGTNSVLAN
jgi:hypothetical protein